MEDVSVGAYSFIFTFGLIIYLVFVLSLWQIFNKAGEKGWYSLIPIYNVYVLTKIANQPVWVFILLYVPVIQIVASIMLAIALAKSFSKSTLFAIVGLVLFPYFGYMILGWGDAQYKKLES